MVLMMVLWMVNDGSCWLRQKIMIMWIIGWTVPGFLSHLVTRRMMVNLARNAMNCGGIVCLDYYVNGVDNGVKNGY